MPLALPAVVRRRFIASLGGIPAALIGNNWQRGLCPRVCPFATIIESFKFLVTKVSIGLSFGCTVGVAETSIGRVM